MLELAGYVVGMILMGMACALMYHHKIIHNYWYDWHDINNHETVALTAFAFGFGIVIGGLII